MKKGTIDRIEDDSKVVVLVEKSNEQFVFDKTKFRSESCHPGAIIEFSLEDGDIDEYEYKQDEEKKRRERIEEKYDRLSEKLSEDSE